MYLNAFNDESLMSSLRVQANVDECDVARFSKMLLYNGGTTKFYIPTLSVVRYNSQSDATKPARG